MTARYHEARSELLARPKSWLVTGVAGFIGSNLLEALLILGQDVVGLDSFATGHRRNLDDVRRAVGDEAWRSFRLIEGDIRDLATCQAACHGVEVVLHQAALGSVPRSLKDPIATNQTNIDGFLNMLVAAREARVARFIYAASSSTYGDHPGLPKVEDHIGRPLSPYAVTKYVNELYAGVFARAYGIHSVGLRYFNVFGRRQDPDGPYAAAIPRWIAKLLAHEPCRIFGDGETSRDFCYVENVVQANLLAATVQTPDALDQIYNVAYGQQTTLNELFRALSDALSQYDPAIAAITPTYEAFRPGDIRHSLASIDKARDHLGYEPAYSFRQGLEAMLPWYLRVAKPDAREVDGTACE